MASQCSSEQVVWPQDRISERGGALELLGGPCTTAPVHTGVASSDHWLRTYCVSWRPRLTPAAQGPPGTLRPEE